MDRELAKALLPFVNSLENLEDLDLYIQYRINHHRDHLEQNSLGVPEAQGALRELRRFKTLRDEVHRALGK